MQKITAFANCEIYNEVLAYIKDANLSERIIQVVSSKKEFAKI